MPNAHRLYGQEYEKAGFKSITRYLDNKQISRLVFFWIILSSVFIAGYPLFQINLKPFLIIILLILNVSAIGLFYFILFRKKDGNTRLAFIVTNIFLSLILIILLLNSII